MNEASIKIRKRPEARRLEWSALFVAFLLVALAPQTFAVSSFVTPSTVSQFQTQLSSQFSTGFALGQISHSSAAQKTFVAQTLGCNAATQISQQHTLRAAFHLDEQRGTISSISIRPSNGVAVGGHPEFGRTFVGSPAVVATFSFLRTHTAHRFAAVLHAHEAAFLSGTRTNHFDE